MELRIDEDMAYRFDEISHLIGEAHKIAICAHTNPDGDALGSELALAQVIRNGWQGKEVCCLLADPDPVPRIYRFLPGSDELVHAEDCPWDPDLFVVVDLSAAERLNEARPVLERSRKVAIIDHHPCEHPFGDAWVIRPQSAAAGVLVAIFALFEQVPIDSFVAQNLLCAIVTDTGRYQYQNTNSECLAISGMLVEAGASPALVSLNVYQSFSLTFLHLKSAVMGRIVTFERGRIAYSYATTADLERTGASLDECDGLIDVVRSVEGSEVALFLKEVPGDKVRGNLRSKSAYDISGVARELGGGGHRAAAGFTVEGDIDEALARALPLLRALFHQGEPSETTDRLPVIADPTGTLPNVVSATSA